MNECLPWVALLERCRGVPTRTLGIFYDNCIKMFKLGLNDTLMNEMYMVLSYALLERLGEEREDTMKGTMKYDCYDFDIEKAFGLAYVFASPDWERFLSSFTDNYETYPPKIAPHPSLNRLGLYYFDKDVAVLVTPAGIYQCRAASLSLKGPAYLPLSYFFDMWGE